MAANQLPIVGITMGDPAGIGPEICCKMFAENGIFDYCRPLVIGDSGPLNQGIRVARVNLLLNPVESPKQGKFRHGSIDVVDLHNVDLNDLRMGEPQAMAGKACVEYIQKAVSLALANKIDAIVTAPINKKAMNMAGYKYSGHTELLADLTKSTDFAMLLVAGPLRVIHVSTHVSLREALNRVKKRRILTVIRLANQALKDLGVEKQRIAVAGLNPHAGEDGLFGTEEKDEITPAIEAATKEGITALGPIPPDTVFPRAKKGEYDVVVAMYHDQGHVAIKMLGLELGVNVSIGLPIIRTSVDHGTAYRRAGLKLGTGDQRSLVEATKLAAQMVRNRKNRQSHLGPFCGKQHWSNAQEIVGL